MFYIYLIKNIVNNKVYIGKSMDVFERIRKHLSSIKNVRNVFLIHRAIIKYGIENFIIDIIDCHENEDVIYEKEIY